MLAQLLRGGLLCLLEERAISGSGPMDPGKGFLTIQWLHGTGASASHISPPAQLQHRHFLAQRIQGPSSMPAAVTFRAMPACNLAKNMLHGPAPLLRLSNAVPCPAGPVKLLTHPISAGYIQNPISVYYCHDAAGRLQLCIAEVTNTPWAERVTFLFRPEGETVAKSLHVSPLMDMSSTW